MSLLAVQGGATGTGTVTLLAPVTNTNRTITLPDETGTAVTTGSTAVVSQAMLATNVAGNGPAFGAYQSSATALTANAWTKITFDTEEFDTNSNFASSRFTPTVAGYYQINASTYITSTGLMATAFYKNGSLFKQGTQVSASVQGIQTSSLLYMNGSTDYIEFYVYQTATQNTLTGQSLTWFNGYLARSA